MYKGKALNLVFRNFGLKAHIYNLYSNRLPFKY